MYYLDIIKHLTSAKLWFIVVFILVFVKGIDCLYTEYKYIRKTYYRMDMWKPYLLFRLAVLIVCALLAIFIISFY